MPDPYLSIGEVLALLLEEFPDVTISKIRFLESQGLIDPERTPSGYRKFYDLDVDRLRVILREQRENFLPLRVIRDRLESGEIDETGSLTPPRGLRNVTLLERGPGMVDSGFDETGELDLPEGTVVPTAHHPAAQSRVAAPPPAAPRLSAVPPPAAPARPSLNPAATFFAGNGAEVAVTIAADTGRGADADDESAHDTYVASELCTKAGITSKQLAELESFGLLAGRGAGISALYTASDLAIARAAAGFLERGIEPRHLRAWRQSAEREAALFEQLVVPLIRQRNPQSRQHASQMLTELSRHGGDLRSAILSAALQHHLEA
ncbi:MAG TPA: MerR family transcriptional regulator [Ilumatobacteraceae bacterium]|nr:MerR family transcriptional regulator [Ilumatobacteraceae bacterium]HRB04416.1 MerR family transcriptional regulator [Ilumatobacteraceae bacterium]